MNRMVWMSALILLGSCGFRSVKVIVHQNPVVKLGPDVKKIAVVNLVKNNTAKKVGALLFGEIPSNDEKWSAQFIQTCEQRVTNSPSSNNLRMVTVPFVNPEKSSMMYQFSQPMDWKVVDSICKSTNAQGVLTVDYFGAIYDMNVVPNTLNGVSPLTINPLNPTANGTLRGYAGFRYYDLQSGKILIQQPLEYYNRFGQSSNNQRRLYIQNVPVSTLLTGEAYRYVAQDMGEYMAAYFVPTQFYDYRKLAKSGSFKIKKAFRYARSGNWAEAASIWKSVYENPKTNKEKWQAAYNLAVYYEINTWYDEAEKILSEAYSLSGKRKVYKFIKVIQRRRAREMQTLSQIN